VRRSPALLLALALTPAPVAAQRVTELGLQAITTIAHESFGGAGVYAAVRLGERTRLAGTLALGSAAGRFAGRGEVLGHFLLSPTKMRGVGLYALGGAAWAGGPADQGYVVVGLGLEARPGARSGWGLEAGVGGGFRLTAGYRWRWFPAGWTESR
jgi:hypothetical protein